MTAYRAGNAVLCCAVQLSAPKHAWPRLCDGPVAASVEQTGLLVQSAKQIRLVGWSGVRTGVGGPTPPWPVGYPSRDESGAESALASAHEHMLYCMCLMLASAQHVQSITGMRLIQSARPTLSVRWDIVLGACTVLASVLSLRHAAECGSVGLVAGWLAVSQLCHPRY
jgi:hypothetical protein